MSDDANTTNDQSVDAGSEVENTAVETQGQVSVEEQIKSLTDELTKTKDNLDKSRKAEKHAKTLRDQALETAKTELATQYEDTIKQLTERVSQYENVEYETKLANGLAAVGAIDTKALSKLIGKVENVDEAIQAAVNDYPSLFTKQTQANAPKAVLPSLAKSTEGIQTTTHQQEVRAALDRRDFAAVRAINAKYGVKSY